MLKRCIHQRFERGARQHTQDQQHSACTGSARFQHLIRIDEEIFAHRRDAVWRERCGGLREVRKVAIETGRLGEHRHRGGTRVGIGQHAPRDILIACIAQCADGRRAEFHLGDEIEPLR